MAATILRDLSPQDARLLQSIRAATRVHRGFEHLPASWVSSHELLNRSAFTTAGMYSAAQVRYRQSVDNLIRLGLCEAPVKLDQKDVMRVVENRDNRVSSRAFDSPARDYDQIRLTFLGVAFNDACTPVVVTNTSPTEQG